MHQREFGRTGLAVSELGFGAWAIGGTSYGPVDERDALGALARAEELGCNFVDTAAVYGDSESILGRFLAGRRDRWVVASKYSGQPRGMTALVEEQLERLGTSWIDFYQIHWTPRGEHERLYDELQALKEAGKVRFTGVSLATLDDIDTVLARPELDGFQVPFSLLDPRPLSERLDAVRDRGLGVVVRSSLKSGFLTGKFDRSATFDRPGDHRGEWSEAEIAAARAGVEAFRFLEADAGSLLAAALGYPLAFPAVSTVIVGTKDAGQAEANFRRSPPRPGPDVLARIEATQARLGLLTDPASLRLRRFLKRVLRASGLRR